MLPIVSSSMSPQPGYEVFLCFRGLDTRNHFADFLYYMLTDVGIRVFRDEEDLQRGRELDPQLIRAIEQSKISLPVISMEFASSRSCLMESVQMVDCMRRKNHTIIPIFYLVDPSHVRGCSGPFATVSAEDQKSALGQIGKLKGYHHVQRSEAYHTEVLKKIVREVELKLKKRDLSLPKQFVPVDPHVQEIMAKLKVDYRNGEAVEIGDSREKVLIYGIPGVGKTVLAKCVYNKLNHLYDACSFLENIQAEIERKRSVVPVQNRLISHLHKRNAQKFDCRDHALKCFRDRFHAMKVLVLLDDVKDSRQLDELVGELDWLSLGSTVIVTSQRDDVLDNIKGTEIFCLGTMQQDKALQLFCRHAFEKDSPPEEFEEWSAKIAAATDGLPLALKDAGKSLIRVEKSEVWMETLTALKQAPAKDVREALSKSYDTLEAKERDIFLDIACFCNGKDVRIPCYMWDACEFSPTLSIPSLRARSLVEIGEDEELCMRGILKTFGREIVKNENSKIPWRRSRLCNHKEALDVLRRRKGTEKVEALGLEFADGSTRNISFQCDRFEGLEKLRFLKLDQADIQGNFSDHFSSLRWLDWRGCPKIFDVQSLNLNLQELVILDLSGSRVDGDWSGWELLEQARKLKVLKLTGCVQLTATPKFPASTELERLVLEGCSNLAVIDPSFHNLEKLVSLNMKECSLLCELPDLCPMRDLKELVIDGTSISRINFQEGSMRKLETLSACDCKNLTEIFHDARNLEVLKLTGCVQLTATPKFPASIKLKRLILEGCSNLAVIDPSFRNLEKLVSLNMQECRLLCELPDLGPMRDLKELVIDGTSISRINFQEGSMRELKTLSARDCKYLNEISESIRHLESLTYLALDGSVIFTLPESIEALKQLKTLSLKNCKKLTNLPDGVGMLKSLKTLSLKNCKKLTYLPDGVGMLKSLQTLSLKNCQKLTDLPDGIGKLISLQVLDLSNTEINKLPTSVKDLKAMKVLRMGRTYIREFPEAILSLEKLEEIDFSSCRSLGGMIPDEIRGLKSLAVLNLSLTEICGLPECLSVLSRLQKLNISRCDKLESPPELPPRVMFVNARI